ncbi:MAG: efflux RND transporter periplasmic adaptor subunit [Gammaproteobacteria bacterium]
MSSQQRLKAIFALSASLILSAFPGVAEDGVRVSVAPLSDIAVYPQKTAAATVISLNETSVSTEIDAIIKSIPVQVGDVVKKGALLARLDCTDYVLMREEVQARIASLDARTELARKRLQRAEKLIKQQTVAEELLDERASELAVVEADLRGAAAQLRRTDADIERCKITSPLHAVITSRVNAEGEFVKRGTAVLELIDIEQLELSAYVSVQDTGQLDAIKELFFEDATGSYPLVLRTVVPAVNTVTRNREVRLLFEDKSALPGAAGKLVWQDNRPHIPGKLLVRRENDFGVFTYVDGRAYFHIIGDAQQGRASAVDLPLDTLLITAGQFNLQDGQAISQNP